MQKVKSVISGRWTTGKKKKTQFFYKRVINLFRFSLRVSLTRGILLHFITFCLLIRLYENKLYLIMNINTINMFQ
jgi:hypothetical protein